MSAPAATNRAARNVAGRPCKHRQVHRAGRLQPQFLARSARNRPRPHGWKFTAYAASPPGVLVQDLFGEVFDDTPASTTVTLLRERCPAQFSKDNALREGRSRTIDGRRTPSAQSVTKPRLPQSARSRSHFDWARTCQHRRCGARRDRRLWGNKTRKRPSSRSLACDFGPLPFKRQVGFLKKTDASVR